MHLATRHDRLLKLRFRFFFGGGGGVVLGFSRAVLIDVRMEKSFQSEHAIPAKNAPLYIPIQPKGLNQIVRLVKCCIKCLCRWIEEAHYVSFQKLNHQFELGFLSPLNVHHLTAKSSFINDHVLRN